MRNPFECQSWKHDPDSHCCVWESTRLCFTSSYIYATRNLILIEKSNPAPVNNHVIPFLLRHSIELILKNELLEKCEYDRNEVKECKHDLWNLLSKIKCETNLWNYISEEEIMNFSKHDASSFEFRYPISMKQSSTCVGFCCFSLDVSMNIIDSLILFLKAEYSDRFNEISKFIFKYENV